MKEIVLDLACDLDDADVNDRAQRLAAIAVRRDEVDTEKRNTTKILGERLAELEGNIRSLSKVIRERSEFRPVTCVVMFHSPVVATKRVVRPDTGDIVREEPMSSYECQSNLFEEKAASEEAAAAEKDAVQGELLETEPKCENCESPATTIDNPDDGVPLCQPCKDALNAEDGEPDPSGEMLQAFADMAAPVLSGGIKSVTISTADRSVTIDKSAAKRIVAKAKAKAKKGDQPNGFDPE